MADRRFYWVRKGTWPELLFLLAEAMLSHVLTFLQDEFKYPSWHGSKARRQQLASQWLGEPAVITKKTAKFYRVVRGLLFPANQGTCISLLGVLLLNCSKQSIPNPEQKTICQNKTLNAFPMANRMCCENEAATESLSWLRNSDNYHIRLLKFFICGGRIFQDQICLFHCHHNKNCKYILLWNNICCFMWRNMYASSTQIIGLKLHGK